MKVFISYSPKDRKFVQSLCGAMEKAGITSYVLGQPYKPNINWGERIERVIKKSDCLLEVLTHNGSRDHFWMAGETGFAQGYGKPIISIAERGVIELIEGGVHIKLNPKRPDVAISRAVSAIKHLESKEKKAGMSVSRRGSLKAQKITAHIKKSASRSLL